MNVLTQNNFQCGHIISEYNGGPTRLSNLHPICRECNLSMGSKNWDDWLENETETHLVPPPTPTVNCDDSVSYSSDFEPDSPKRTKQKIVIV